MEKTIQLLLKFEQKMKSIHSSLILEAKLSAGKLIRNSSCKFPAEN